MGDSPHDNIIVFYTIIVIYTTVTLLTPLILRGNRGMINMIFIILFI